MRFDYHHQFFFFFSTISRKFSNLIIIRRGGGGGGGSSSIDSSFINSNSYSNSNNSNNNNANAAAAAAAAAKIIRSLVQQGHYLEALLQFSPQNSSHKFTIPSLLKACSALCDHNLGKTIHGCITALGLQSDPYIAASLINMYVKCGSLSSAVHVFDKMSDTETLVQDVTLWNSIIDGYFRFGFINHGFIQFRRMQFLGVRPDAYSLSILLLGRGERGGRGGRGGGASSDICSVQGKQIHGYIVRNVFDHDPFLDTALIDMYARCGRPTEACKVFDKLEDKSNIVVWNAMISGFYQNGLWEKSLEFFALFKKSVGGFKLGSATFASVLAACSHGEDVNFGRRVHCDLIKLGFERDTYVSTSLLTLYAKCRLLEDAQTVFHQVHADKEIELWNAMISAFIGNHCVHEALDIYKQMRLSGTKVDSFTIANVLAACSMILLLDFGSIIHGELIKRPVQNDTAVQSALLTMYAKCGSVEEAYLVFNMIKEKDVVTWGSMISGFFQNKKFEEALSLFRWMKSEGVIKSDATIMASVVGACGGLKHIELGCGFHGLIIKSGTESDVFVGSTLVDMYARFGLPEVSAMVFFNMPQKNLVAWNSMICCYNRNDLPLLSISLFPQILQHGLKPDSFSLTNVIVAISSLAALRKGKAVHGFLVRAQSMQSDIQVENALVDMYIKCGCLKYAQVVFRRMHRRNIVTWNSMIAGYGSHGESRMTMKLFDEMLGSGILPDGITFLALISSCSHSGLIEEGLRLFQSMRGDYGIEPWMDHYVNMVSLWGRAGHLQEAYRFIQRMPIEADGSVWLCLLWSCRTHRNAVLGELAAGELLKLEPNRVSNYVQLLNLYGEGERWEKAASLRVSMKERGLKKNPGCSWIEIKDQVQVFFSGDSSSSPRVLEIYDTLRNLWKIMGSSDISWDCDDQ